MTSGRDGEWGGGGGGGRQMSNAFVPLTKSAVAPKVKT